MTTAGLTFFQELFLVNQTGETGFLREKSREKFLSIGLPNKKNEAFQYFPALRFAEYCEKGEKIIPSGTAKQTDSFLFSETMQSCFVFLDGTFEEKLSCLENLPEKIVALPLDKALKGSYASFLRHRLTTLLEEENDPLALLNGALFGEGLFIYVPPKLKVETPLQFLFLNGDGPVFHSAPRIHILVGGGAEIQIVSRSEGRGISNAFIDVAVEEGAVVSHTDYSESEEEDFGFTSFRASLKKESFLHSLAYHPASRCRRVDYKIFLKGERGHAEIFGLGSLSDTRHLHTSVHMEHAAPSCRSEQLFKSVLSGQSRASFTGKIYVKRVAQKTEAYQLSRSLLLSEGPISYTKPNLEIFADDVKASHGATISRPDLMQKFYLQSRGLSSTEASSLLTRGFCAEILEKISLESLKKKALRECSFVFDKRDEKE